MDKIKKFLVDQVVLSYFFKDKDLESINKMLFDIEGQILTLQKEAVTAFLLDKGVDKELIDQANTQNWDTLPQEVQNLLRSEDLIRKISFSIETLYKSYFEKNFDLLSAEDQNNLIQYVNNQVEIIEEYQKGEIEIDQAKKEVLEKYNVNTYEELKAKLASTSQPVDSTQSPVIPSDVNTDKTLPQTIGAVTDFTTPVKATIVEDDAVSSEMPQESIQPVLQNVDQALTTPTNEEVTAEVKDQPRTEVNSIPVEPVSSQSVIESAKDVLSPLNTMPVGNLNMSGSATNDVPALQKPSLPEPTSNIADSGVNVAQDLNKVETPTVLPESVKTPDPVAAAEASVPESSEPSVNSAVDQLQSMGIDLNDALSQPPQS